MNVKKIKKTLIATSLVLIVASLISAIVIAFIIQTSQGEVGGAGGGFLKSPNFVQKLKNQKAEEAKIQVEQKLHESQLKNEELRKALLEIELQVQEMKKKAAQEKAAKPEDTTTTVV